MIETPTAPSTPTAGLEHFSVPVASAGRLEAVQLSKVYPGTTRPAVERFDLSVEQGEFITLLGPSGCGKTTTLRMIAGFEHPTSGSITLDGRDMVRLSPDKRPMAMVFQSYALFPHMSVRQNISYGLEVKKLARATISDEVESALAAMDLGQLADRSPARLSGGQQQRVALARAMVMKPEVLLFDEPLSNLDAKLRVQLRAEIKRVQSQLGITSIYVTHDQEEAMTLSDRVVVMNNGRIEQVDAPTQVYRRPSSDFVADFLGRSNFIAVDVERVAAGSAVVSALGRVRNVPASDAVRTAGAERRHLLVRPESFRLGRPDRVDGHAATGRILSVTYSGESVEYEFDVHGLTLTAKAGDPRASEMFAPGETVTVDFIDDQAWLLPAS